MLSQILVNTYESLVSMLEFKSWEIGMKKYKSQLNI